MNTKNGYFKTDVTNKFLHRVIYEKHYPNFPREYEVHHIDGNKINNSIENLVAIPASLHNEIHNRMNNGEIFTKVCIEKIYRENKLKGVSVSVIPTPPIYTRIDRDFRRLLLKQKQRRLMGVVKSCLVKYRGNNRFVISLAQQSFDSGVTSLTPKQISALLATAGIASLDELARLTSAK